MIVDSSEHMDSSIDSGPDTMVISSDSLNIITARAWVTCLSYWARSAMTLHDLPLTRSIMKVQWGRPEGASHEGASLSRALRVVRAWVISPCMSACEVR